MKHLAKYIYMSTGQLTNVGSANNSHYFHNLMGSLALASQSQTDGLDEVSW